MTYNNRDWPSFILRLPTWIIGLVTFITAVVGFLELLQGNTGLVTLVCLVIGVGWNVRLCMRCFQVYSAADCGWQGNLAIPQMAFVGSGGVDYNPCTDDGWDRLSTVPRVF
jgi:hypothetical protein